MLEAKKTKKKYLNFEKSWSSRLIVLNYLFWIFIILCASKINTPSSYLLNGA